MTGQKVLKDSGTRLSRRVMRRRHHVLLVLTAVGDAYKREDGVYVAPINMLKP